MKDHNEKPYVPSQQVLENYANVLVNFALNECRGIQAGNVVHVSIPECAKPMLVPLRNAILKAGGHPIMQFLPDDVSRSYFEVASDKQLSFFPDKYYRGIVDQVDHSIAIIAETDPHELEGISPAKIMMRQSAFKPYKEWREEKENAGKYTWTLALFGTPQMAKEVNLSQEEYWQQIIEACFLDKADPVAEWKRAMAEVERVKERLNSLEIESVHIVAPKTDLVVGLGKNRRWMGGSGRNIPSFEVFISPDWRKTEGYIQFTEKLYRYGNLIENVYLEFKGGKVVKSTATSGEDVLKQMIATPNADKIGEFSLTDSRISRITKFMGETLYDENVGGRFGNTHLALGSAYKDSYPGDPSTITKEQWEAWGYNDSIVHTDIVATSDRTVTATLPDGKKLVIYKDGKFTI